MKKFYSIALMFVVLLSAVLFSACGDKYGKLSMSFYSSAGVEIDNLELLIDNNAVTDNSSAEIGVKFINIETEDIGSIIAYSPSDVVTASNYRYDGDMCYFTVKANKSSLNSKIIVKHLASNKIAELSLVVNQKSNDLQIRNSNYVVSIPDGEEINTHYINSSLTYGLLPSGSTDKIYFKFAPGYTYTSLNVEPIWEEVGENQYVTGFRTTHNSTEGKLELYPVTYMEGYGDSGLKYLNETINVHFTKTLNADNLMLVSDDDLHNVDDITYLIANDKSIATDGEKELDYAYNSMNVSLKYKLNNGELAEIGELNKFYTMMFDISNKSILASDAGDNHVVIQADASTEEVVDVQITFAPNGYVGDINTVSKTLKVKGEAKSDKIQVKKKDEIINTKSPTDIFDYYASGSSLGALFKFEAINQSNVPVYKDLKSMRLYVDPAVLNVNTIDDATEEDGTNDGIITVYKDSSFGEVRSFEELKTIGNLRANKFVLDIYIFGRPLKFYYDDKTMLMVSEVIDETSDIYIKYTTIKDKPDLFKLSLTVASLYSGSLAYLQHIKGTSEELVFAQKDGVASMYVDAGFYPSGRAEFYSKDMNTQFTNIYLNRLEGIDNQDVDTKLLWPRVVKDIQGNAIDLVDFEIKVIAKDILEETNSQPLKVKQGAVVHGIAATGATNLQYVYNKNEEVSSYIGLVFTTNTSVGNYEIIISQLGSGYSFTLNCVVYQDATNEDINTAVELNSKTFVNAYTNNNGDVNKFEGYTSDYIVAAGQSEVDFSINLPISILKTGMVSSYELSYYVSKEIDSVEKNQETASAYFEYSQDGTDKNYAELNFKNGTYSIADNENNYLYLNITVKIQKFVNIITPAEEDDTKNVYKTISFFIYNEVTYEDISINYPSVQKYMYSYLGEYNKVQDSEVKLQIDMEETLWNYIQPKTQNPNLETGYKIGLEGNKKVVWIADSNVTEIVTRSQDDNSISLRFDKRQEDTQLTAMYTKTITAVLYQFNTPFYITCNVTVLRPIIAEKVEVTSEISLRNNGEYAINLKLGQLPYAVQARSSSTIGEVSNPGFVLVVCDNLGSTQQDAITLNQNTLTLEIKKAVGGLKLIVFAKDALNVTITEDADGFDDPAALLIGGGAFGDRYKNAYIEINLELSDGKSEATAYIIDEADDFWEINELSQGQDHTVYYKIVNNIDLTSTTSLDKNIIDFEDVILTDNEFVYTIYGLELTNENKNLFVNFGGTIKNIIFSVKYSYNQNTAIVSNSGEAYLGVFDVNNGTLENVSAEIYGSPKVAGNGTVYFGGLVAENNGTIIYTDATRQMIGVTGNIAIYATDEVTTYFGGIVGKNVGSITGYDFDVLENVQQGLQFIVQLDSTGLMSNATINTELLNSDSAVGGVIGLNTYNETKIGTLTNAEVSAVIKSTSNADRTAIGGVVGKNEQIATIFKKAGAQIVTDDKPAQISNIKSYAIVEGYNNIGGVVGYDKNGIYSTIKYQILNSTAGVAVKGNKNVGGIAGTSLQGRFKFVSVMSYRIDYTQPEFLVYDIQGNDYVGGIIGSAISIARDVLAVDVSAVAVYYSSVNAYISSQNNVGGILTNAQAIPPSGTNSSVVYTAYFLGKLEGFYNQTNNLCLDNDANILKDIVYSVNYVNSQPIVGAVSGGSEFIPNLENSTPQSYFGNLLTSLNGGYYYVIDKATESEGGKPIFDIAPTEITATVKDDLSTISNKPQKIDNTTIWLNYYSFVDDSISGEKLAELNEKYNMLTAKNLQQELFAFNVTPSGISAKVKVEFSDPSVLEITADNRLVIKGIGEGVLSFTSVLNSKVKAEIKIIVTYPMATEIGLVDVETGNSIQSEVNIAKGVSKLYSIDAKGYFTHTDDIEYQYKVNSNINLNINISNYQSGVVAVSGAQASNVFVDYKTPLSISVYKKVAEKFAFTVTPSIKIADKTITFGEDIKFALVTVYGASDISLNYDKAILYPNDKTIITGFVVTDKVIDNFITNIYITDEYGNEITNNNYINVNFKHISYNEETYIQLVEFEVEILGLDTEKDKRYVEITISAGDVSAKVNYTILPQRINTIEIKNYINEAGDYILSEVLKQDRPGLIIIDMAPSNGYFDYLEIVDVSGSEEISFTQLDKKDGNTLPEMDEEATLGKGIKLVKVDTRIYVRTEISALYSSKIHTIKVYAFVDDQVVAEGQTDIDVKMLPNITATQIKPNGKQGVTATTEQGGQRNVVMDLALGTDIQFNITTRESDGLIKHTLSGEAMDLYSFVHDGGNFYKLDYNRNDFAQDRLGQTFTLTLQTYSYLDNSYEVAEINLTFRLVNFVVHDVSVSNTLENNGVAQVYGNINQNVELKLYFKATDISYYNNGEERSENYVYDSSINNTDTVLGCINEILRELNSVDESGNSKYITVTNNDGVDIADSYIIFGKVDNVNNVLYISNVKYNESTDWFVNINFTLGLNADYNYVPYVDGTEYKGVASYNQSYIINFTQVTSMYAPKLVKNEHDFKTMTTGYYILGNDLVLTDYTPLNVAFTEFDGNGRTITIESFDTSTFKDENLALGLFTEIVSGSLVKNLTVKYSSIEESGNYSLGHVIKKNNLVVDSYFDICENKSTNYTSATFGGLAATNNGIITNCKVVGEIALRATTLEEKSTDSTKGINFNIGGLVATNGSTGYITNSKSALGIFAQANIGGFVYSNDGKIVSCAVDEVVDYSNGEESYKPFVYNYNTNITRTITVELGGFVVANKKHISMSYTNFDYTILSVDSKGLPLNTISNLSAKDISAGFVYTNTGAISDSYAVVLKTGNNNAFSGFAHDTNAGTIENAYTFINEGNRDFNTINMFAPSGSSGIKNCIELVDAKNGYEQNTEGLYTIPVSARLLRSTYEQYLFAFGDNENAIWKSVSGSTPKLVSTLEEVIYTKNQNPRDINGVTYYYGLQNITVETKQELVNGILTDVVVETTDASSYGTRNNPFIIYDAVDIFTEEKQYTSTWTNYFKDNSKNYYRIVADVDFSSFKNNPKTSSMTFSGNIQGNNMTLKGFMLYSSNSLNSIGLFKEIVSINDLAVSSAIRNLTISATSVWATKTQSVGLLAGIVENYNLYNISIDAPGVIIVGGNAVGGVAGVVRGAFDIAKLRSNIGVNSTKATSPYNYSIYASKNNGVSVSNNLANVYYGGSVVAILDGYNNSSINLEERDVNAKYFEVRDIIVDGSIVVLADTVGSAFGFVGERVKVDEVIVNLTSSKLSGYQYSAGAVGENRGILQNTQVTILDEGTFDNSNYVSAGVVGLNAGGLVQYVNVLDIIIEKETSENTVAGIIGRNINGVVTNATFNGKLLSQYTGGIIGSNYKSKTLKTISSGAGALSDTCKTIQKLLPINEVVYKNAETPIINLSNTSISQQTWVYFMENLAKFYSNKALVGGEDNFAQSLTYKKVLGLCVGLTDNENYVVSNYGLNKNGDLVFNGVDYAENTSVGYIEKANLSVYEKDNIKHTTPYANIINYSSLGEAVKSLKRTYVAYITGTIVKTFDAWGRTYSNDMLIFTNEQVSKPMWTFSEGADYVIAQKPTSSSYTYDSEGKITSKTVIYNFALRNVNTDQILKFDYSSILQLLVSNEPMNPIIVKVNGDAVGVGSSVDIPANNKKYSLEISGKGVAEQYPIYYIYNFQIV